jgi:hypothetical protein
MREYVCLLAGVAFLAVACQKKETTVTNPPEENKTEANTAIVDEAANTPVTNLPLEKKTETKTANLSPTPTPAIGAETTLPTESSTPFGEGSPAVSSETDTNLPAGNTTGGSAGIIGGSSSSSSTNGAEPGATVNPARDALRREIMQGRGTLPSPTP